MLAVTSELRAIIGIGLILRFNSSGAQLHPCPEDVPHGEQVGARSVMHPHSLAHAVVKLADDRKLFGKTWRCWITDQRSFRSTVLWAFLMFMK